MFVHRTPVKKRKSKSTDEHPRISVRFASPEERELVESAAFAERLSINAWLTKLAIDAARKAQKRAAAVPAN